MGIENKKVDLVFLIDSSDSMKDEAAALSEKLSAAIEEANKACPSDLRVEFLGIEGTFANSKFDKTVRNYLTETLGVDDGLIKSRKYAAIGNPAQEDVAPAAEDVIKSYDWRAGAEKNLFVLGDESLYGGEMVLNEERIKACDDAISVALDHAVKVHTYLGTPHQTLPYPTPADERAMIKEYKRLALRTGGEHYIYTKGIADFIQVLKDTICASKVPHEDSVDEKKEEADKLEGKETPDKPDNTGPGSSGLCEQAADIVRAVNTLADVLKGLVESCGPQRAGDCTCHEKPLAKSQQTGCKCEGEPAAKKPEPAPQSDSLTQKPPVSPPPAPASQDESTQKQPDQPISPPVIPASPQYTEIDELFAIAINENSQDGSDIYSHDPQTGKILKKVVDNNRNIGQSNALTTDGYSYYFWSNQRKAYREKDGKREEIPGLSGKKIDGMAFRKDNTGFMFTDSANQVYYYQHDPATLNMKRSDSHRLQVTPGPGESVVAFGRADSQKVTDMAFDSANRAYFIGLQGRLWVVEDTSSTTSWLTRYLFQFEQLETGAETQFTGITFDSQGYVYLCGRQINKGGSRRFIAKGRLEDKGKLTLLYKGDPGGYANITTRAFPDIAEEVLK
ncbi:hypothetical protein [Pseudomonas sp. SWRI99]|uniref:hypothetical protein n=1 Tax=Pseudomonas sp. SWRI99 TaxID=2745506 RepID=UPI0016466955|nr:hypothetical protein [Pseudomonas sp. SWRI99]MBC3776350.1 hypothetical protein [Pseudomonas sp. SWRI99]